MKTQFNTINDAGLAMDMNDNMPDILIIRRRAAMKMAVSILFKKIIDWFTRVFDFNSKRKTGLQFYTEFPSGIISPVFNQLGHNKNLIVAGIKDLRTMKKMRSLNLIILVHPSSV